MNLWKVCRQGILICLMAGAAACGGGGSTDTQAGKEGTAPIAPQAKALSPFEALASQDPATVTAAPDFPLQAMVHGKPAVLDEILFSAGTNPNFEGKDRKLTFYNKKNWSPGISIVVFDDGDVAGKTYRYEKVAPSKDIELLDRAQITVVSVGEGTLAFRFAYTLILEFGEWRGETIDGKVYFQTTKWMDFKEGHPQTMMAGRFTAKRKK